MKWTNIFWVFGIIAGLQLVAVYAQETDDESSVLKRAAKVDKPIADTYEPLNSTYVGDGDRLNQSIEQSWTLKKQSQEQNTSATGVVSGAERAKLEKRILEPGSGEKVAAEPLVESTDESLSIREP